MDQVVLEKHFSELIKITDRIAMINSPYESDLDGAFIDLEEVHSNMQRWDIDGMSDDIKSELLGHLSFHREILLDILGEARSGIIESRRPFIKRLARIHKNYVNWFERIEFNTKN